MSKKSKESRPYSFQFTWHNYTDEDEKYLQGLKYKYLQYGYEICPTTQTPHLQGMIIFKDGKTISAVRKLLKPHHVEVTKRDDWLFKYNTLDGKWVEFGERPTGQGARTDIASIKEIAKKNPTAKELVEASTSLQSLKYGYAVRFVYQPKRSWKTQVEWYYGESGAGKSYTANKKMPNAYWHDTGKWFCGYDSHEDVILDDLRPDVFRFSYLLRLLDENPMTVETKGAQCQWLPKRIIVTSTIHPDEFAPTGEKAIQLRRRINNIQLFFKSSINGISEEISNTQTEKTSEENKETSQTDDEKEETDGLDESN